MIFRKRMLVFKVETVQMDNKLFITDGHNVMRYIDLATNKVHIYKAPRGFRNA